MFFEKFLELFLQKKFFENKFFSKKILAIF